MDGAGNPSIASKTAQIGFLDFYGGKEEVVVIQGWWVIIFHQRLKPSNL
jgi:hypothetical protein